LTPRRRQPAPRDTRQHSVNGFPRPRGAKSGLTT